MAKLPRLPFATGRGDRLVGGGSGGGQGRDAVCGRTSGFPGTKSISGNGG